LKTAIFGGTFDPIHCAHLAIAREAAARFALDRVLFVVAANPPHKPNATVAPYEDRYRMVELACQDDPRFEPSRLEAGPERSYSIKTICRVRSMQGPSDELYFIIGSDAFADICSWHRWEDVVRSVDFIVVTRPGCRYSAPPGARVHRLDNVELPVSSSEIRRRLAAGFSPPELPPAVLDYIRERGLYGHSAHIRPPAPGA
jgi:nicotinate-nucleotide adenylyltransferase